MTPLPPGALHGRVVLVAGAAGGLGRAVALASAGAGATVVLLGRRVPALERVYDAIEAAGGPQPGIFPLDLEGASPSDYAMLAERVASGCGRLDGIVHAAAHFTGLTPLEQTGPEDWLRALHVNLSAPWLLTQACLPLLRAAPSAAIVFVLEDAARVERAYWGGYAVAKGGLESLVRVLHDELEHTPVRVAALRAGPMRTALRARAWFAEDPRTVPPAGHYAAACVRLLAGDGRELDARPAIG
jgi:NAD(P)-dependent dehydrogenase (short-subunit alcohol dehydrogenase family)